jgi:hypothetical protein
MTVTNGAMEKVWLHTPSVDFCESSFFDTLRRMYYGSIIYTSMTEALCLEDFSNPSIVNICVMRDSMRLS